jgi:hypothetical protein
MILYMTRKLSSVFVRFSCARGGSLCVITRRSHGSRQRQNNAQLVDTREQKFSEASCGTTPWIHPAHHENFAKSYNRNNTNRTTWCCQVGQDKIRQRCSASGSVELSPPKASQSPKKGNCWSLRRLKEPGHVLRVRYTDGGLFLSVLAPFGSLCNNPSANQRQHTRHQGVATVAETQNCHHLTKLYERGSARVWTIIDTIRR